MSNPAEQAASQVLLPIARSLRPRAWLLRHAQVLLSTLGHLARQPLATLLTAAVIGIALALPAGLYVLLENVRAVSEGWEGAAKISLFLRPEIDDSRAEALVAEFERRADIDHVRLITRAEALEEYRRLSGFGDVLDVFQHQNPLPAVLVVEPAAAHTATTEIHRLVEDLGRREEVEFAQFDLRWVERLRAITAFVQRGVLVLGALLALGVLLVVGNTIRLGIENRREEIEVTKLCGGTDAFIRRPFLYTGVWFGALGAVLAWVLAALALELLRGPVAELAALYGSDFRPQSLSAGGGLSLLGIGAGLGLGGSWLAVGRHLSSIEPG